MNKKNIAVLFGGQSSEHEVSCKSATTIIEHIDHNRYEIILLGITKEGRWLKVNSVEEIKNDTWRESSVSAVLSPDAVKRGVWFEEEGQMTFQPLDVVFPALHGPYGEDGTVQGLLEMSHIPYVGCGVLASAVSMDKYYTKIIVDKLGIRQAAYVTVYAGDDMEASVAKVEEAIPYPVFIKPCNAGSSRGVSRADTREELIAGIVEAGHHDKKMLIEEMIVGRELECAVLGSTDVHATGVGEILAAAEFYDYDAKYNNEESRTVVDPELPDGKREEIREAAMKIFKAVDGFGLSRVDFFLEKDTNVVIFNEINTLPGFTSISMYPMLWEGQGLSKDVLVEKLIQSAFMRNSR